MTKHSVPQRKPAGLELEQQLTIDKLRKEIRKLDIDYSVAKEDRWVRRIEKAWAILSTFILGVFGGHALPATVNRIPPRPVAVATNPLQRTDAGEPPVTSQPIGGPTDPLTNDPPRSSTPLGHPILTDESLSINLSVLAEKIGQEATGVVRRFVFQTRQGKFESGRAVAIQELREYKASEYSKHSPSDEHMQLIDLLERMILTVAKPS